MMMIYLAIHGFNDFILFSYFINKYKKKENKRKEKIFRGKFWCCCCCFPPSSISTVFCFILWKYFFFLSLFGPETVEIEFEAHPQGPFVQQNRQTRTDIKGSSEVAT